MRVYTRKFDWEEARRLRAEEKLTYQQIADLLGVTDTAVMNVCNPKAYARAKVYSAAWQRSGVCVKCGAQRSRNSTLEREGVMKGRCVSCAAKERATSVREDELQCVTCREWKTDDGFPFNASQNRLRRGRHSQCRVCQTEAKRSWRKRNPGR